MTVDAAGNVYVTGDSRLIEEGTHHSWYDYRTVKFDPTGNRLWAARFNGSCFNDHSAPPLPRRAR